ncbi:MAG: hypothetical protein F6K39_28960 [Okeania sp. SIO3B3]|nr:hypothetical protein [Okeania sp. SIO3B3]
MNEGRRQKAEGRRNNTISQKLFYILLSRGVVGTLHATSVQGEVNIITINIKLAKISKKVILILLIS